MAKVQLQTGLDMGNMLLIIAPIDREGIGENTEAIEKASRVAATMDIMDRGWATTATILWCVTKILGICHHTFADTTGDQEDVYSAPEEDTAD